MGGKVGGIKSCFLFFFPQHETNNNDPAAAAMMQAYVKAATTRRIVRERRCFFMEKKNSIASSREKWGQSDVLPRSTRFLQNESTSLMLTSFDRLLSFHVVTLAALRSPCMCVYERDTWGYSRPRSCSVDRNGDVLRARESAGDAQTRSSLWLSRTFTYKQSSDGKAVARAIEAGLDTCSYSRRHRTPNTESIN